MCNVYRSQHHLTFFLPYGLCLVLTLPIVASGLISLRFNGVSAVDGDFLQFFMTAATGKTEIEVAASRSSLGGYENISKELKKLKIRFEELLGNENMSAELEPPEIKSSSSRGEEHDKDADGPIEVDGSESIPEDHENRESEERRQKANQAGTASGVEVRRLSRTDIRRAGFGVFHKTKPLRRGDRLDS